jgi:hypothetical protein
MESMQPKLRGTRGAAEPQAVKNLKRSTCGDCGNSCYGTLCWVCSRKASNKDTRPVPMWRSDWRVDEHGVMVREVGVADIRQD